MAIRDLVKETKEEKLWFTEKIDNWFLRNCKKKATVGYFRPSGVSECMRENQYCYIGVAKYPDFDLASLKRMYRGTVHHEMWEQIFREAGIEVISGKINRIESERPKLSGEPDWFISKDKKPSKLWLIDWKSMQYIDNPPNRGYMIQWNLYSYYSGVEQGYIIKESPVTLDFIAYPLVLEKEFIEPIIKGLCNVEDASKEKILLPRDERCGRGKLWTSRGCELRDFCYSEQGENPWELLIG